MISRREMIGHGTPTLEGVPRPTAFWICGRSPAAPPLAMPLVLNMSPGYRPPTSQPASPAKQPAAPDFSIANAAATAVGVLATGCLNIREKLLAYEAEQQRFLQEAGVSSLVSRGRQPSPASWLGDSKHALRDSAIGREHELSCGDRRARR